MSLSLVEYVTALEASFGFTDVTDTVHVPPSHTFVHDAAILRDFATGFFTVILTEAFTFLFFFETAVILTFPAFLPVTTPFDVTVAIFLLLDLKVTALEALFGFTVFTFTFVLLPTVTVVLEAFNVILVGFFAAALVVVGRIIENATAIIRPNSARRFTHFFITSILPFPYL